MAQCKAQTRAKKRCRLQAVSDGRCHHHAPSEAMGPNERAVVKTLKALGRKEDSDAATWQLLRSLAAAVDANPFKAALWSAYREALSELMKDTRDGDSSLEEAVAALRGAAPVGDSQN